MNATESLLFNELFIDYLKDIFFEDPKRKFEQIDVRRSLPQFYEDSAMVNAGIAYLLRKQFIVQTQEDGRDLYHIAPNSVAEKRKEKAMLELNRRIDFAIKKQTLDQLNWDRIPKKYWWAISIGTAILGGLVAHFIH